MQGSSLRLEAAEHHVRSPFTPGNWVRELQGLCVEIVAQHAQQVDVVDRQLAVLTGQYPFQEGQVLTNLQLVLGGIVEDPEADLVAQPLSGEESRAGDLIGDLVEAILQVRIFAVGRPLRER